MNLFEKIQAVSMEVMNVTKDMNVGSGVYSYKAVSDLSVTLAIKKAESAHKIVSIPIKQELINSEIVRGVKKVTSNETTTETETFTYVDSIKMTTRFIDVEEPTQFIDVESFGKGIDNNDKGFGKASTYARKYCLLNAYKIATGEDPDADHSDDFKPKEKKTTTTATAPQKPSFLDLDTACKEMSEAKDKVQITTVWNKYLGLQKDTKFIEVTKAAGEKLPKQ